MQRAHQLAVALLLWALPTLAATPPTIDGADPMSGIFNAQATVTSASSGSVSITTTQAPDIILLFVVPVTATGPAPVVSTVDGCDSTGTGCSGALTWRRRSQQSGTSAHTCFGGSFCAQDQEVWWANSTGTLTSHSISVVFNKTVNWASMQAIGVNGVANPANPWDPNGSLPSYKQNISTSTSPWVSNAFSTTNLDDLLIATFSNGQQTTHADVFCTTWKGSPLHHADTDDQNIGYLAVVPAQSSVTVSENGTAAAQPCDGSFSPVQIPWFMTVDALTGTGTVAVSNVLQFQTPW